MNATNRHELTQSSRKGAKPQTTDQCRSRIRENSDETTWNPPKSHDFGYEPGAAGETGPFCVFA